MQTTSRQGFSLVQVLVAAGIIGILSLAAMKLIENTTKGQAGFRFVTEVENQVTTLKLLLAKDCKNGFVTGVTPANVLPAASGANAGARFSPTVLAMLSQPAIASVELRNKETVAVTTPGRYMTELVLHYTRPSGAMGPPTLERTIPMQATVDATLNVIDCLTSSGSGRSACPLGYTFIGALGSTDSFCISTAEQGPATPGNASAACFSQSEPAHLCSMGDWLMACSSGTIATMIGNMEVVANPWSGNWHVSGAADCTDGTSISPTSTAPYRCCLH